MQPCDLAVFTATKLADYIERSKKAPIYLLLVLEIFVQRIVQDLCTKCAIILFSGNKVARFANPTEQELIPFCANIHKINKNSSQNLRILKNGITFEDKSFNPMDAVNNKK